MKYLPGNLDLSFTTKLTDLSLGDVLLGVICLVIAYYVICFILSIIAFLFFKNNFKRRF